MIGQTRLVRAAFSFDIFGMNRPDDVRLQSSLDGGGLMDVGCYCVSGMRLLAGEPVSVSGRRIDGGDGVDVRFTGTMAFSNGVLGSFDCGLDMVARSELELIGDAGSLFLADPWHSRDARIELRRPEGTETVAVAAADPYACELEDFAAAVRGERPHPFGRADAVGQARVIAALYRAADSGARGGALRMPVHDPEGPGQLLLSDGEPVAMVVWAHDFAERSQTGWFFVPLDDDGEPDHALVTAPGRLRGRRAPGRRHGAEPRRVDRAGRDRRAGHRRGGRRGWPSACSPSDAS